MDKEEVWRRVYETDDILIWAFLIVSLGGLFILLGQGVVRTLRKWLQRSRISR